MVEKRTPNCRRYFTSKHLREIMLNIFTIAYGQCDQIGRFFKFVVTNLLTTKVAQILRDCFTFSKNIILNKKLLLPLLGNFWGNLGYFVLQHLVTLTMEHRSKMMHAT